MLPITSTRSSWILGRGSALYWPYLRTGVLLKVNLALWNTIQMLFPQSAANANPPTPVEIANAPARRTTGRPAHHTLVASSLNHSSRPAHAEFLPPRYASADALILDFIQTWLLQTATRFMYHMLQATAQLMQTPAPSPLSSHRCARASGYYLQEPTHHNTLINHCNLCHFAPFLLLAA